MSETQEERGAEERMSMRTAPKHPSKTRTMTTPGCAVPVQPMETPEKRPVGRGGVGDGQTPSHFKH